MSSSPRPWLKFTMKFPFKNLFKNALLRAINIPFLCCWTRNISSASQKWCVMINIIIKMPHRLLIATKNLLPWYLTHHGLAGAEWLMLCKSIMHDMADRNKDLVKYYRDIRMYELGRHSRVNKKKNHQWLYKSVKAQPSETLSQLQNISCGDAPNDI